MPPTHISGTSRALWRVFIAPSLRTPTSIPLLWAPAFACPQSTPSSSVLSYTPVRTKTYKKDTARHALTDHYVLDSAIRSHRINLVDANGVFHPGVPTAEALSRINRITQHLVQVALPRVDESGNPDPDDVPTCRVMTKMALREQHEKKLELARRHARGLDAGSISKNLELSWAIAGGDLKHRLGRLKAFLSDGKKVEVLLGPKKRGRKATEQEATNLVQAVRDAVKECKGAKELKSEGDIGGIMTLTFEPPKAEKKKEEPKAAADADTAKSS